MMKRLSGSIDLSHSEFRVILSASPEMEDNITIPLFGSGVVTGLNDGYMGREETWVMVQWANGESTQFEYKVSQ